MNPFARGGKKNLSGLLRAVKGPDSKEGKPNPARDADESGEVLVQSSARVSDRFRAIADYLPDDPGRELMFLEGQTIVVTN